MSKHPPSANMVVSMAAQPLTWRIALAEWIDNSLDANAKGVHITFDGKSVNIKDDGSGCADLIQMMQHRQLHG